MWPMPLSGGQKVSLILFENADERLFHSIFSYGSFISVFVE